MKDLTLIVLDDETYRNPIYRSQKFTNSISSLTSQLSTHNISHEILECKYSSIPSKVDSGLVTFAHPLFLVQSDYIFNAISLNNILRDAGILFGPVFTESDSKLNIRHIKNTYYEYDLNFGNTSKICDITKEPHNYGSLYNAIISGAAYNRVGFSPSHSPRMTALDNPAFFNEVSKFSSIYYCSNIPRLRPIEDVDLEEKTISDYYYAQGYRDGLSCFSGTEKKETLWKKFVESPETIDGHSARWLFYRDSEKFEISKYLELLVVLKCKYQIGFFEAITGKNII